MKNQNYLTKKSTLMMQWLTVLMLVVLGGYNVNAQFSISGSAGGTLDGTYATLTGAGALPNAGGGVFAALNSVAQTGATITVSVTGNSLAEPGTTSLNAGAWTSITISPSGGAARTISGTTATSAPLQIIDFNGADNVTINGLNASGNSLTIANLSTQATSGTSTIRFIGGATNNTITNCNIQGSGTMSVATNGATIFFSTDALTANGNDNNTISNNNIGPAGANLPTKAILGNGSITTQAIGNSGIVINNNNIFDFFGAAVTSSGIAINGGCNTWSITNNRFYQTGTRTWTTGATHRAIDLNSSTATSGVQGMTVTGNIVGYASNTQTGIYTLTGAGTGAKFVGIFHNGIVTGATSTISNNTVAAVSVTGVTGSGTTTSSPFTGILFQEGNGITNGNTIGSQGTTGSLTFSTTTTSSTDVYGIFNFSSNAWISNTNNVGGISVTNLGASGTFLVYGMRAFTAVTTVWTATSNVIGGTVANSIQLTGTGTSSQVVGMFTSNCPLLLTSNTVRNLTSNIGTGTTSSASVVGILNSSATPNSTLSQNTIFNLSNTNTTAASVVTGIQFTGSTANVVERNLIYGLTVATNSTAAEINGIRVAGGTTIYRNNMIALGAGVTNAIGAVATNSSTTGINGINEALGTDQFFHNSVYIGGSPTAGTGASYAFNGTQTTNTRSFRDNIFFNARSNSGATGKNYAIKLNGTTTNPTGLTINNNVYFANGSGSVFGFFNSLDVANLAAWKTAVGQDAVSFESNPQYIDPTNATPDLHLHPTIATVAEGNGLDVGVTNDYDGQTRSSLTPVDIGADAGNYNGIDLAPPVITYAVLGNTVSTANRPLVASITDAVSGVPTSGVGLPVIYFRKGSSGAYSSTQATSGGGGTYNFTIDYSLVTGGSVVVGDLIQYYVVAQDGAATPNVTSNPTTGALGYSANPPAASTPPTPNSYLISTPFNGTYTVPGSYPSLTNSGGIFEAINNGVVTADINIEIAADLAGELGTNGLNAFASPYTVKIYPTGIARSITGSFNGALIRMNGSNRVTIDGSLGGSGTDRSLTISNTSVTTPSVVLFGSIGTTPITNNTLKNCIIINGVNTSSAVVISDAGTLGNAGFFSNITIQNNDIQKAFVGVFATGGTTPQNGSNLTYTQNTINTAGANAVRDVALYMQGVNGATVSQNTVGNLSAVDNENDCGIWLATGTGNATVSGNTVTNLGMTNTGAFAPLGIRESSGLTASGNIITGNTVTNITTSGGTALIGIENSGGGTIIEKNNVNGIINNSTGTFGAYGINVSAGNNAIIRNNFVSNVTADMTGGSAFSTTFGIFGIRIAAGTGHQIYYNSVNLYGLRTGTAASSLLSAAFCLINTTSTGCDVRNNIFANNITGGTTSIANVSAYLPSSGSSVMNLTWNKNAYFYGTDVARQGVGQAGTTAGTNFYTTLAALTAYSNTLAPGGTNDNASQASTSAVPFLTNTDLHINYPAFGGSLNGAAVSNTGVSTDIDGQARGALTPDIGADEFGCSALTPTISGVLSFCPGSSTTLNAGSYYSYSWSTGATSQTISVNTAGSFTVIVTDGSGCTGASPSVATTINPLPVLSETHTDVSCFGGNNGTIDLTATGNLPFTYNWTGGITSEDRTGLIANIYSVTVTDANFCTKTLSISITQPTVLSANCSVISNVNCFGGNNGSVSVTGSGGTPGYTISPSPTGLTAGTYTFTVTDANGCTATCSSTITQPIAVVANCSVISNVSCFGGSDGSVSVSGSGGTGTLTISPSTTGLSAGTYTFTVTDANGCTATCSSTITQPTAVVANCSVISNVSCFGGSDGSVSVIGSGGTGTLTISPSTTGLSAGTYTFTVTDANGCTATCSSTIAQPSLLTANCSVINNVSCRFGSNGAVNVTGTGGTLPYSISPSPSGLAAGTYTFTITDAHGCTATCSSTITQPALLTINASVANNVSCFGGSNGSVSVNINGGTSPYGVSPSTTGLAAGTYTFTVTDFKGCTATASATISQPTALSANCSVLTNVNCFGGNNGSVSVTGSGGTSPYSVSPSTTGLTAGTYTFTVTDFKGCTATCSSTITQPSILSANCSVLTNVSINGGSDGSVSVTGSGGTSPYTVSPSSVGLSAGTYTFTVTDANGCTATCSSTITQPTPLAANCSVLNNVSCFGGSNGAISVTGSGGAGGYTYSPASTGLAAGTYTFTVTDANGATATCSSTITQPSALSANCSVINNVSCFGGNNGSVSVTGSGGTGSYSVSPSTTGLSAGTYTFTLTDVNGCTATCSSTTTQPTAVVANCSVISNVSCFGGSDGSVSVTGSGGTGTLTITPSTTGLSAGTYTFTVTDANGCTATCSSIITQPTQVSANCTVINNVSCNGGSNGSISVSGSGGTGSYTISPSTTSGLSAGVYTFTVTDANGCTATCSSTITQPAPLSANCSVVNNVSCNGGSNGSVSVSGNGGTSPYSVAPSTIGLAAGTYTFTVTDANGCTATCSSTITEPTAVSANCSVVNNVSCFGGTNGSVSVSGSGGIGSYSITPSTTGLAAGTYTFTVTDANGCSATCSSTITQPTAVSANCSVVNNVSCFGGSNGAVNVSGSGGTGGYTISPSTTGLVVGTYTFTVTDANGCSATCSSTITQPTAVNANCSVINNVSIYGGSDGAISVNGSGGTGPYTINPSTTTGLIAGTYTFTVTDANGCSATCSSTITQPSAFFITCSGTNISCNTIGTAGVVPGGGVAPYTYLWTGGYTTATISGVQAGTYCVSVTDANGATASCCHTILQIAPVTISSAIVNNITCKNAANGSISINVSGVGGPFVYHWNTGSTNTSISGLNKGNYYVTVTDSYGCSATASYTITQPNELIINFVRTNIKCGGSSTGSTNAAPVGGTTPYAYVWNTGAITSGIAGLPIGSYTVTVTDANGCVATKSVIITQNPPLVVIAAPSGPGQATANASGGVPPYTYLWNIGSQTTQTATGLLAGHIYKVKVADSKNCSKVVSVNMPLPKLETISDLFDVMVYPNPTDGIVNLVFSTSETFNFTLKMFDATGRLVFNRSEVKANGSNNLYNFSSLPKGIYSINIQSEKGSKVLRIVLQ